MGVILGTVPGWQRDSDYSEDNRTYLSPGYQKYDIPSEKKEVNEILRSHKYKVKFDIEIYLYDSPCRDCVVVVTRRIQEIEIYGIYNEYQGEIEDWAEVMISEEVEELIERSNEEVGGLLDCPECDRYKTTIVEKKYVLPMPKFILDEIEYLEEQKVGATQTGKESIQKYIDMFKGKYSLQ